MVEENFKLNINLQLDQSGLTDLQRQIEKAVKDAFTKATRNVKVSAPGAPAAGPTAATARSAREAISVSGRDLGRSIQQAIRDDLRGFEQAAQQMERAVDRLAKIMERGQRTSGGEGAGGSTGRSASHIERRLAQNERVIKARAATVGELTRRGAAKSDPVKLEFEQKKLVDAIKRGQKLRESQRRVEKKLTDSEKKLIQATEKLADARERQAKAVASRTGPGQFVGAQQPRRREEVAQKQVGPSNQQTGANIDATRRAGSERTAGTTTGNVVADAPRRRDQRVGSVQDRRNFGKEAARRIAAREDAGQAYTRHAQTTTERVAKSIDRLEAAIRAIPQFREADLGKVLGLPSKVGIGRGAAPTITTPSGQEKVIKQAITVVGDEIVSAGDVITQRVERLLSSGRLESGGDIEKTSRFRPKRAEAMLREEIRQMVEGPKIDSSMVMGGFAAAGQARMTWRPTEDQRRRIAGKAPGAEQIAEAVAILHDMTKGSESFRKAGLEMVSVIGLAEDKAAALSDAIEAFAKGDVDAIEGLVQTRNLAGMGVGGAGAMRQARSFLMTQTQEMVGGEEPKIKGIGEELAYAGDIFGKKAAVHLKTAVVSADLIPELKEDQFLLDKQAAKNMGMLQKKSMTVKDLGEDIVPGMMLEHGKIMGKDVKERGIEFDLKGAQAQVTAVTKIIENGIAAWKVEYEELNEMVTGGKMTTRAGGKGIVRVEEDLPGKYGLPEGTQMAMSAEGMAKRGDLRTMIELHAGNIGKEIGEGGQTVADMIVDRMLELGEALNVAVKTVASQLGLEGYTGAEVMSQGPLAAAQGGRAAITTGEVAWMRLAKEGQRGPASLHQRFLDKPGMQAMEQRAETIAQAKAMQANMAKVVEENYEFIATLQAIAGASNEATAGLKEIRPEAFTKMEAGLLDPGQLKGTVLDPDMGEAMKLMLPTRGGVEEAIRLPAAGKGLGRRDYFETELGQVGASDITKMFDKLIAQAKQVRVATGQIDLSHDAETYAEAAQITSKAIKSQVAEIYKLGKGTEEGKAAMREFIEKFLPMIETIEGAANIQFAKIKKGGGRDVETFTGTSAEYVKSRKTLEQKMLAVQDILAERAATKTAVRPGSFYGKQGYIGTESIGRMGAIFDEKNAEVLTAVMEELGVTMQKDAGHVEELYSRLEKLKEQLVSMLALAATGTSGGRPAVETLRPYGQAMGGGIARAPMAVATEFRTDISGPLVKARERLEQLRDAGQNVDKALAAVDRIAALQVDVEALPRDAVMLSKKDFENLKRSIMADQGIGEEEALKRMERGTALRYPVTGGQSMQVVKILQDAMGTLTEGKVGVAGPPAGEPGDIAAVIGELEKFRASLAATIEENKGFGAAADAARREIATIDPVIEGLRQSFISATQNLDFDGDKIAVFGALSEEASKSLRTFTEQVMSGGVSLENILNALLTGSAGRPGGGMGGVDEYANLFGQIAKGRTGTLKSAVLVPDTAETARFEAQAHTGGKTSVGLLSDAFNKLQLSILGGAEQTGDALATGVERIMLFINKSLAQKHGGGGAAGPMEFVETFARGPSGLKEIFAGMDEMGDDIYGELGKFNKEYREKMYNMLIAQPRETVQQLAKEAGAIEEGEELTSENFTATIKNMVDKMDLKGQFSQMWDMLEENMKQALLSEGMGAEEVSATMQGMLKNVSKRTGKPEGLDLNRLLKNLMPEYRMTRRVGKREIQEMPAMEQAQKVLSSLGIYIAGAVEDATEEFDIDVDPKDVAQQLVAKINSFMESVSSQFEVATRSDFARSTKLRGAALKSVRGQHVPDPQTGGPGRVLISQERLFGPLVKAIVELEKVAAGTAPATKESFSNIGKALSDFAATLAHEGVHKAVKEFPDAIESLQRRIGSSGGDLHEHANEIYKALDKLSNVKRVRQRFQKISEAEAVGATEYKGRPIREAKRQAGQALSRLGVEELVAHLADPQRWQKMFGRLPDAVQEAARNAFAEVAGTAPEIIKPVQTWAEEIRSTVAEVMQATFEGEGVDAVRQAAQQRIDALASGEPYPGREQFHRMRDVLGAGEKTLAFGRRAHGLAAFQKSEGVISAGKIDIGAEDLLGPMADNLRSMLKAAAEGLEDPGMAGQLERDFKAAARQYYEALKGLGRDQYSGSAWKDYQKVLLEFQAAEATSIINKARNMEKQIADMRAQGQQDLPEFRDLLERFGETVQELFRSYEKNIRLGGVGRGTASGLAVTPDQLISDPALEMGLRPTGAQYQQVMQAYQGREGTADFAKFAGLVAPMEQLLETIDAGEDATKQWTSVWDALLDKPEAFYENMVRVKEILAKWSRLKGLETDPFSEASLELKRLSDEANNAKKAMDKLGEMPKTQEGIDSLRAMNKQFGQIYQRGRMGSLAESIKEQMENAKKEAKRLARELTEAVQQGIELPRHFEPRKVQIVDPKSGQVLQVLEMQAKRTGKSVEVALKQGGRGAQEFGGHMKNALRRVVQWGFATGIVYGTMRAFRNLVDTIVTVEQKIANLKKVMDTSVVNFERMQDGAVDFAREFGVSIDDVLDGMVVYGQQGLKVNKIMERTRATMLAVNVTTLSSTEATEALTAAHKVFGDAVSGSTGFVDAWANVAAKHAITAKDLADAVKRSGAAAQVAGVGFEDFLGVVTAIGAVTRQTGKEVATSTKFMFRAMRRPTAQKQLGKMGIQSMTAGGDFRPAMDILKEVAGGWDNMTRAQQVNTAQAMAGIRHYNSFIVLMENFDEALLASADAANSQGFAMRKNRIAMATVSKQMQVLRESIKGVALEIGKAFLPAATSIVDVVGKIIGAVGKLPGPVLQVATLLGGLGITIHKGLDLALDSIEAIGGAELGDKARKGGMIGMAKALPGGFKSMGEAAKAGMAGAVAAEGAGLMARGANAATRAVAGLGSAATTAVPAIGKLAAALGVGTFAIGSAAILAIVAALGGLYYAYYKSYTNAKKFEESMEGIIGRSEDAASSLRAQVTQADRLTLAYKKFEQSLSSFEDPAAMRVILDEGRYKSASVAAQKYSDMVADMSRNLAQVDPSKVQGITETGDYVMGISDSFKSLTQSALDAQNALTVALKTDVIKKYAEELKEPQGAIDNLKQAWADWTAFVTGGAVGENIDKSVLGKLKDVRQELDRAAKLRQAAAEEGRYSGQGKLNDLVEREVELRQEALAAAQEMQRVFESMPVFEDMQAAMQSFTKDLYDAMDAAAATGQFGRGVTGGATATAFMAKQAGLGGIIGAQQAVTPGVIAGTMAERGIRGIGGAGAITGAEAGEMAVVSRQVAEALMGGLVEGMNEMDADRVLGRAQVMFAELNTRTGEMMYRYFDETKKSTILVSAEALQATVEGIESQSGTVANAFMRWSQKEIEASTEHTKKVLSLQYTGVLAGIRQPTGGMPQIGPARDEEVSAEQRILKEFPAEMQRLADVQSELNQITREYSEDVLQDVEGAYKRQGTAGKAIKVATHDILQLATQLQKEGFNLTVLAHYSKAQHELNMILEQAAEAARDAAAAEELKMKYDLESAGAMAGVARGVSFDFGKSRRELSGMERARLELPGFDKYVQKLSALERQKQQQIQTLIEIEKRKDRFEDAVRDLAVAGEELTAEQMGKYLEAQTKGATPGDIELLKQLEAGDAMTKSLMESQLSTQDQMLQSLHGIEELTRINAEYNSKLADLEARTDISPKEKKQVRAGLERGRVRDITEATRGRIEQVKGGELMGALGKILGAGQLDALYKEMLNITVGKSGRLEAQGSGVAGVPTHVRQNIAELMQALEDAGTTDFAGQQLRSRVAVHGPGGEIQRYRTFGYEGTSDAEYTQMVSDALDEMLRSAFGGGAADTLRETATELLSGTFGQDLAAKKEQESIDRANQITRMIAEKRIQVYSAFEQAQIKQIAAIEQTNKSLEAAQPGRMAIAANELANSIDQMIKDFQKSELIHYEKVGSDLEGPMARVGQPGFRTQWENRRREIDKQYGRGMRPLTIDERRARDEAKKQLDFDEKEANIKAQQDVEVGALRQQQQQAESMVDLMAAQLTEGTFAGTGMEGQIRKQMEILKDQLSTSEQAEMRGDELYFKGIPALEDMKKFAQQMRMEAKEKAKEAQAQLYKSTISDPIVQATNEGVNRTIAAINNLEQDLKSIRSAESKSGSGVVTDPATGKVLSRTATGGTGGAAAAAEAWGGPHGAGLVSRLRNQYKMSPTKDFDSGRIKGTIPKEAFGGDLGTGIDSPAVDFRKYFAPQVGISNNNVQNKVNSNAFGNSGAVQGAGNIAAPGQDESELPGTRDASGSAAAANESAASSLEEAASALQECCVALDNLASTGLTIPDSLESTLNTGFGQIETALTSTLNVEVTNTPLDVNVSNASEIGESVSDGATSAVGADIADAQQRLTALEGVANSGGTLDSRVTAVETGLETETTAREAGDEALGDRIDTLQTGIESLDATALSDITTQQTANTEALTVLDGRVTTNENNITTLQTDLETAKDVLDETRETVVGFDERITTAEDLVSDATIKVEELEIQVGEIEDTAEGAVTTAEAAQELAADLQEALTNLATAVESHKQSLESQIRVDVSNLNKTNTSVSEIERQITELNGRVARALDQAGQARAEAQRR